MVNNNLTSLLNGKRLLSPEIGILHHISKLPRVSGDPFQVGYGVWPCNNLPLGGEKYGGQSSGVGYGWENALLGTMGETVERYSSTFINTDNLIKSSYKNLKEPAIHPSEFALFHEKQYKLYREKKISFVPFNEDTEVYWDKSYDLTSGKTVLCPCEHIYMPFEGRTNYRISATSTTGLSSHTNFYKAILTSIYEIIERDSFVLTWMQNIPAPKITITSEIQEYLNKFYPKHYEWHFIDITYDLNIPTVFGICIGEAEFGKFIAIGASSRGTYSEALKKTISEIGQAVPYFRYMLDGKKKSKPIANFYEINSFDEHAIFYTTRPDLIHVFDIWRKKEPQKIIDFNENLSRSDREQILYMAKILKDKGYNFLVNDLTTPDVNQAKFYVLRVVVPQLLLLSGAYGLYFSGGKRLYEVPEKFGYKTFDFDNLNSFPHPFP